MGCDGIRAVLWSVAMAPARHVDDARAARGGGHPVDAAAARGRRRARRRRGRPHARALVPQHAAPSPAEPRALRGAPETDRARVPPSIAARAGRSLSEHRRRGRRPGAVRGRAAIHAVPGAQRPSPRGVVRGGRGREVGGGHPARRRTIARARSPAITRARSPAITRARSPAIAPAQQQPISGAPGDHPRRPPIPRPTGASTGRGCDARSRGSSDPHHAAGFHAGAGATPTDLARVFEIHATPAAHHADADLQHDRPHREGRHHLGRGRRGRTLRETARRRAPRRCGAAPACASERSPSSQRRR